MVKGQTKNGMAIGERGNEALSTDVVKILKSQDAGYVRICIAKDEKVSFGKLRARRKLMM
jgi:U3 small nucleolar RNA-associated protein 11